MILNLVFEGDTADVEIYNVVGEMHRIAHSMKVDVITCQINDLTIILGVKDHEEMNAKVQEAVQVDPQGGNRFMYSYLGPTLESVIAQLAFKEAEGDNGR